jgi:hypothetical protein
VFWLVKQPSWQVARACGESAKQASTSAVRNKPCRKGERLIEFLVSEVLVFIKQPFRSPRLVNSAIAALNEGKKLSGEATLSRIQILVSTRFAKNLTCLAR